MKIYLEDMVAINFFVNLILLNLVANCLCLKIHKPKLLFCCFFASVCSIFYTLYFVNIYLKYLLEIFLSLFILSFSYKNLNAKKFVQTILLMFVFSNFFSGTLNLIGCNFKHNLVIDNLISSILSLFILSFFATIIKKLLKIIVFKQKATNNICAVEINFNNKHISTFGYFDTGNNLVFNQNPVSIVNYKLFESLTNITLSNFLTKNFNLENIEYINTSTLTGTKKLLMLTIDEMTISSNHIKKIIKNPKIALSLNLTSKDYDIILNNQYI